MQRPQRIWRFALASLFVLAIVIAPAIQAETVALRAADQSSVTSADVYISGSGAAISGTDSILPLPNRVESTSTVNWAGGSMLAGRVVHFGGPSIDPALLNGDLIEIGYRVLHDRPTGSNSHPFRVALAQDGRFYQNSAPEHRDNVQDSVSSLFEDTHGSPSSQWHEVDALAFGDPGSIPDTTSSGSPIGIALMLRHGASSGGSQTFSSSFEIGAASGQGFEVLFGVRPSTGFVLVGDPANPCDVSVQGCPGSVAVPFEMGRFEITVAEYTEFLNAVAAADTYGLYNASMSEAFDPGSLSEPGLERSGVSGSYIYSAYPGREDRPISYVSFWDAARYANWLHNRKPVGPQGAATTEDGAYTLTPAAIADGSVTRNPGARYSLPSLDEWYKAAFYESASGTYWAYATHPSLAPSSTSGSLLPSSATRGGQASPTRIGNHFDSASPNGTYNQEGNLREWTDHLNGPVRLPAGQGFNPGVTAVEPMPVLSEAEADLIGFRVVRSAEPSLVPGLEARGALILCGLLAMGGSFFGRPMRRSRRGRDQGTPVSRQQNSDIQRLYRRWSRIRCS
jgi:formylglycine-generating enzyme required for sulfatase activity